MTRVGRADRVVAQFVIGLVVFAVLMVVVLVALVSLRHELNAERRARCAAELALERSREPDQVVVPVGPDSCRRLEAQ